MDDERWKPFDVYNVQSGIAAHYIEHALTSGLADRIELVETSYPCDMTSSLYKIYNIVKHNLDKHWGTSHSLKISSKRLLELLLETSCDRVINNELLSLAASGIFDREFILKLLTRWGQLHQAMLDIGLIRENDVEAASAATLSNAAPLLHVLRFGVLTKELCLAAVRQSADAYTICFQFAEDEELALAAVAQNASAADFVPCENLNKSKLHEALLRGVMNLDCEELPEVACDNKQVKRAFESIRKDASAFSRFPCQLVADGELELSYAQWARRIDSVPVWWWSKEEFVVEAVSQYGSALAYAPIYRDNKRIVMAALGDNPSVLSLVDPALHSDPEVMFPAVLSDYSLLRYLKPPLTNDREFMLRLCALKPLALGRASSELQHDESFIGNVCSKSGKPKSYLLKRCKAR